MFFFFLFSNNNDAVSSSVQRLIFKKIKQKNNTPMFFPQIITHHTSFKNICINLNLHSFVVDYKKYIIQ